MSCGISSPECSPASGAGNLVPFVINPQYCSGYRSSFSPIPSPPLTLLHQIRGFPSSGEKTVSVTVIASFPVTSSQVGLRTGGQRAAGTALPERTQETGTPGSTAELWLLSLVPGTCPDRLLCFSPMARPCIAASLGYTQHIFGGSPLGTAPGAQLRSLAPRILTFKEGFRV